jgi:protein-disulfide isomerase
MNISKIKVNEVDTVYGLKIGNPNAPVKVIEFINISCPFCKKWHDDSKDLLKSYVEEGKVQRIIKHFDKATPGLEKGNVVHRYLDYSNPEKVLEEIDYFYGKQNEWSRLRTKEEIADYIEQKRGLVLQENVKEANGILAEAKRANVEFVPTVFIGEKIFDEHITVDELQTLIENRLKSVN